METLLTFVLELYRLARATPVAEFQELALAMLKARVPFRTATWSNAHISHPAPGGVTILSVHTHNEPPEMLAEFTSLNETHTRAVASAARHAGQAVLHYCPEFYVSPPEAPMRDYVKRYGHEHNLLITDTGKTEWLSLYRPESHDPFTAQDCAVINTLMPHLVEAMAINRALAVGAHTDQGRPPEKGAHALVRGDGVFLHCAKRFLDLLREEWPDWSGARLPASLVAGLDRSKRTYIAGGRVCISGEPLGAAILLKAQLVSPLHRLSPRELTIARAFGAGKPYKTIAKETQLAPTTVRNVLQHAYRKLDIDNKAALARLFEHEHFRQ